MRQAAAPAALALAGAVVLIVAGSSTAGVVAATMLLGTAAVVAISLVFYAVGRSEDRERAAEAERRAAERPGSNGVPRDPHRSTRSPGR